MRILALVTASGVVVALSACGSQTTYDVRAPSTTTIQSPQGDANVRCTNGQTTARAKVPSRSDGTGVNADGIHSSASLQLTRRADGSLVITCTP